MEGLKLGSNSYLVTMGKVNNVLMSFCINNSIRKCRNTKFKADVTIEDNVWIGGHVSVLAGVTIEGLCGWCRICHKDVPKFSLVVGNPQRIVKQMIMKMKSQRHLL